ncbi:MAG: OmpH family outer membrane protein [Gammaproteobacteria bacterium]|nr:OmpH family outer membrane protein [Gammaproteobacteria bacterium]MCW8840690.1 OmpH family outer membrane protein [Gammaproteobacteria bacterium]MCW8927667.1 OmpH family outer membrane protein [Gammaproteobacteria bacterium]MCW8959055.1 OmpH family outer membrane protein [Gammaproteobacteria bacterium]MCW8973146.1 OmpH family outer membrane protein [Gammaproteobacteria bacterium]
MSVLRNLRAAAMLFLLAAGSVNAAEAPNIAFVNTPQVLEQAPQAEAVRKTLKSEFSSRDAALVAEQSKLKSLEEKMERDSLTMSEEQQRKLERDILSQKRELKRSRDEFAEDFNIRRNEELAKMQREIARSIVDLAKEMGYDLILESGVIYASERVDITGKVIERLKQDFAKNSNR